MAAKTTKKTTKRSVRSTPRGTTAAKRTTVTTGSLRARGDWSGRVAALTDVREAIDSAVADGARVREAIEARIDRELPARTHRAGRSGRK